jgi:hypothetical protein
MLVVNSAATHSNTIRHNKQGLNSTAQHSSVHAGIAVQDATELVVVNNALEVQLRVRMR